MYLLFNHDLFTIIYIDAFLRRFAIAASAVKGVLTVGVGRKGGSLAVDAGDAGRVVTVAKFITKARTPAAMSPAVRPLSRK